MNLCRVRRCIFVLVVRVYVYVRLFASVHLILQLYRAGTFWPAYCARRGARAV